MGSSIPEGHRFTLHRAVTAALTLLTIQACGGSGSSASTPNAATQAESRATDCKPLVDRVDRLHATEESSKTAADPLRAAESVRVVAKAAEAASKDIDAIALQNADVKALAKDYAAYVREKQKLLDAVLPMMERMDAAGVQVKEAEEASKKLLKGCEKEKVGKPSAACAKKVQEATKLLTEPAMRFGEAQAAMKVFLQDPANKETNERLTATDRSLNERLHSVCERPLPTEGEAK